MSHLVAASRRWPRWCGAAAVAWSVGYGALAVSWLLGSRTAYPWTAASGDPMGGTGAVRVMSVVIAGGCLAGGLAAAATRQAWRRRHGLCPRCGLAHAGPSTGPLVHPAPVPAPRAVRRAAYVALLGVLPWAVVKLVWRFGGDALGMTSAEWHAQGEAAEMSGPARFVDSLGIDITVLAALVGVGLVLALVQRWSRTLPSWLPLLRGRRIPRPLLLVPAWVGAVSLSAYGAGLLLAGGLMVVGLVPPPDDPAPFTDAGMRWIIMFGGTTFAGIGSALAIGIRSFQPRTRPVCAAASAAEEPVRS